MFPLPRSIDAGTSTSKAASLQAQIQSLTDLHSRLQTLRQIPSLVLRPPTSTSADGLLLSPGGQPSLRAEFERIKEIENVIRSEPTQEALRNARDSFQADTKDLNFNMRWDSPSRKRQHPPSPDSPQPYVALERKNISLFPSAEAGAEPLRADGLVNYISNFNRDNQCKLHIWRRTRGTPLTDQPKVLRFGIRDVLIAYLSLVYSQTDTVLICESVTFFAPREKKLPHSQSDYAAYRGLSQQMAHMLQSHSRVTLQSVMNLLKSYSGLFVDSCTRCERVLSTEGHVPPVVRIWIDEDKEGAAGRWEARHTGCGRT